MVLEFSLPFHGLCFLFVRTSGSGLWTSGVLEFKGKAEGSNVQECQRIRLRAETLEVCAGP